MRMILFSPHKSNYKMDASNSTATADLNLTRATNSPPVHHARILHSPPAQQQQQRPTPTQSYQSKYGELLNVIDDLGREIKPTYAGSKMAQERLKKGIMHARTLVRDCQAEVEKSSRQ